MDWDYFDEGLYVDGTFYFWEDIVKMFENLANFFIDRLTNFFEVISNE